MELHKTGVATDLLRKGHQVQRWCCNLWSQQTRREVIFHEASFFPFPEASPRVYAASWPRRSAQAPQTHRVSDVICKSPFMAGAVPFGCGQCLPCRINRRRLWTWRMFYESQLHEDCCFTTLTYSEDNVPALRSLAPKDLTLFLKRLRRQVEPRRFRYFAVGEYGDESARPHYHAILFGLGPFDGPTIDAAWGLGLTATFEFNEFTAQYVAGYTIKKLTRKDDPSLHGRHPEFARMSLRPGIGAGAMEVLANSLAADHGLDHIAATGDVPHYLTLGRKKLPIGRYLRQKIREHIGMPDGWNQAAKDHYSSSQQKELLDVWQSKGGGKGNSTLTSLQVLKDQWEGRIRSIEWRHNNLGKKDNKI